MSADAAVWDWVIFSYWIYLFSCNNNKKVCIKMCTLHIKSIFMNTCWLVWFCLKSWLDCKKWTINQNNRKLKYAGPLKVTSLFYRIIKSNQKLQPMQYLDVINHFNAPKSQTWDLYYHLQSVKTFICIMCVLIISQNFHIPLGNIIHPLFKYKREASISSLKTMIFYKLTIIFLK